MFGESVRPRFMQLYMDYVGRPRFVNFDIWSLKHTNVEATPYHHHVITDATPPYDLHGYYFST